MDITNLIRGLHIPIKNSTFAQKFIGTMKEISKYWKNSPMIGRIFFWSLFLLGVALIIGSYFLPPVGEIHPTTLEAFGLMLSFASVGWGFELFMLGKKNVEVQKGDMSVKVTLSEQDSNIM